MYILRLVEMLTAVASCLQETQCVIGTILHVEDDLALGALVSLAFDSFGFRGKIVSVDTVAKAIQRLDEVAGQAAKFDLVLSDMHLPDGTGLDVVRHARASPAWRFTPVLILSGDVDAKQVGRAYALGANAYVDKSPPGRTLSDVMKSLYQHWAKDAVLPRTYDPARLSYIETAMNIRARHAKLYQHLADLFSDNPSEAAFWLSRALNESNLTNLFGFLRGQLDGRVLAKDLVDEIAQMQVETERLLTAFERDLGKQPMTRIDAYRRVVELISTMNVEALAKSISGLFPIAPVAMEAMRDYLLGTTQDVAAWIDLHADDVELQRKVAELRDAVAPLNDPMRD